jgi:hypothetical protein
VPIGNLVHQEWSNLSEYFDVLEGIHKVDGLPGPQHIVARKSTDEFLLVLFILILVALAYHGYEAFEADLVQCWLIDELNFEDLIGLLWLLLSSSWVGRLAFLGRLG